MDEKTRRYDAVLFDAFNTLWHARRPTCEIWMEVLAFLGTTRTRQEIERAEAAERPWIQARWKALETLGQPNSTQTLDEVWMRYDVAALKTLGIDASRDLVQRVVLPEFRDFNVLYPDVEPTLKTLRKKGYRLAIVSNGGYQQDAAVRLGIAEMFDAIVGSWHVGVRKPEPAIFEIALDALGVPAGRAVMVGDTWEEDVEGARAAGIRALHLRRGETAPGSVDAIAGLDGLLRFLSLDR